MVLAVKGLSLDIAANLTTHTIEHCSYDEISLMTDGHEFAKSRDG